MRRDYFTLDVSNVDWVDGGGEPQMPTVTIDFQGPEAPLKSRLTDDDGDQLEPRDTDVSFRFQTRMDDSEARGVVAVTNRLTGDYILEINVEAVDVIGFIRAVQEYARKTGEDARYRVDISFDGDHFVTYEKGTFLVYNRDGDLMRAKSLIPSGVEL